MAQGDLARGWRERILLLERSMLAADPLFPIASRSLRRAHFEAEQLGLVCVPSTYVCMVGDDGDADTSVGLTLNVARDQGPFVVTEVLPPVASAHVRQQLRYRVANIWQGDGAVAAWDAIDIPRDYCGRLMSSPLCLGGGEQLSINLDDVAAAYSAEEGARVNGVGVRARLRSTRRLCEAPTDLAAQWLANVESGGTWWGTTVIGDEQGATSGTITSDVVVECVVIAQRHAAIEGEGNASDVQIKVQPHTLTPNIGPLLGESIALASGVDRAVVMPGLRWPIGGGSEIVLQLQYASDVVTRLPVRVTLLGRRGGISGACWT